MTNRRKSGRLRTAASLFKPAHGRVNLRLGTVCILAGVLAVLPACRFLLPPQRIALSDLEAAPPCPPAQRQQALVADVARLRPLCTPLGRRLALIQIRTLRDWDRLRESVPGLGPCPDLNRGSVVGLVSLAGTPLDGGWPVSLETVQVYDGGGLVRARFYGGTYWPDGTAYLETGYVPGLYAVLAVDINGTAFYPGQ